MPMVQGALPDPELRSNRLKEPEPKPLLPESLQMTSWRGEHGTNLFFLSFF